MTPAEVIETLRVILQHVPPELVKEAVDMIEGKHVDAVAEFEARRAAVYAGIQLDADQKWGRR